ncbi:MAG TPA: AI-2E family transporter, partial [Beijerinckiaceae bacterium]
IALPLTAGAILGLILGPTADRLRRFGVPGWATYTTILVILGGAATVIALAIYPTIIDWVARAPELAQLLQQKFSFVQRAVERLTSLGADEAQNAIVVQSKDKTQMLTDLVATVTPAFTQAIIFVFALIFFLAGRLQFRNYVVLQFAGREDRLVALRTFTTIEDLLLRYFGVVTTINACLGVLTAVSMWALGLEQPLVWGFLAFALNFLPIVGPLILKALLLVAGLVLMPDLATAFLPVAAYLVLVTVEANFVTPTVVGTRFTINPFLVFLSVVFWSWLWGLFGAFLAMPIVVVATTIYDAVRSAERVKLPG